MSNTGKNQFSGRLRQVRRKDLDDIASMDQDCFGPDLAWSKEELGLYLAKPQSLSTIFSMAALPATKDTPQIIAGYGLASIEEDTTGTIISIAVREAFRGQGLGLRILKHLCGNLPKKGATDIDLQVEETNLTAIRLYKNFGFAVTGTLPDYYAPGRHGLQMMLMKP